MPKLLLYVTQLMPTGGIESHVLLFCENMHAAGIEIDIVVPNFVMNPPEKLKLETTCKRVLRHTGAGNSLSNIFWLIRQGVKIAFTKYDALYTNGQGESIGFFAWFVKRKKIWVHHHHTSGDAYDRGTWGANYRKALKNADVVIACSQRNAGEMSEFLARGINVIPCFSRCIPLLPKQNNTCNKLNFGYYGRLIKEKGIEILCKLSNDAEVSDLINIHIWGEGDTYNAAYFTGYPKVNYHGFFNTPEALIKVVNGLDAFLLLSTHPEGLPISLLEVMSAGVPWIATDRGGIRDIVCDEKATILLPQEADYIAIKTAILGLAADINSGVVAKRAQQQLYAERFSSAALTGGWCAKLFPAVVSP